MDAKRFPFVSLDGPLIGDLAWQIHREGHDVQWYIESESEREIGDGFVPEADDWHPRVDRADVIVFDDTRVDGSVGTGAIAEGLRAEGRAVVDGTPATDDPEGDRGFAMAVLEDHGVNTIPHREFTGFDEGVAWVRENPGPYVIKPLGEVQNVKRLLYVGRDDAGGDVIDVLWAYKTAWRHRMKDFQLQRRVEGVEVAIRGFFDGEGFIDQVDFDFEHYFRDLLYDSAGSTVSPTNNAAA